MEKAIKRLQRVQDAAGFNLSRWEGTPIYNALKARKIAAKKILTEQPNTDLNRLYEMLDKDIKKAMALN